MDWTGERVIPGKTPQRLWHEHVARYGLVGNVINLKGKQILDAPCGTGYGSEIMHTCGGEPTGVDISEETIAYAHREGIEVSRFFCCDIAVLDGPGGAATDPGKKFDVVVCFEGIEHVDLPTGERWLQVFHDVMADDGDLFISTPHPKTSKSDGTFHKREYLPSELFVMLVAAKFEPVQIWAQRMDNSAPEPLNMDAFMKDAAFLNDDTTIKTLIVRARRI